MNCVDSCIPFRRWAGQNHDMNVVYGSLKSGLKSYLGTTQASQNCILEEIKGRLNSGNACSHSFQSLVLVHHPETLGVKLYKPGHWHQSMVPKIFEPNRE
jgi:hypothetical protein